MVAAFAMDDFFRFHATNAMAVTSAFSTFLLIRRRWSFRWSFSFICFHFEATNNVQNDEKWDYAHNDNFIDVIWTHFVFGANFSSVIWLLSRKMLEDLRKIWSSNNFTKKNQCGKNIRISLSRKLCREINLDKLNWLISRNFCWEIAELYAPDFFKMWR